MGKPLTEARKARMREYQQENYDAIMAYQNEYKKRLYKDPIKKLGCYLKSAISAARRKGGWKIGSRLHLIIGLPYEDYLAWIESQWEEGMSWDNYGNKKGQWSFDHKIPYSSATSQEELIHLFHFLNVQPMWQIDNIRKRNK